MPPMGSTSRTTGYARPSPRWCATKASATASTQRSSVSARATSRPDRTSTSGAPSPGPPAAPTSGSGQDTVRFHVAQRLVEGHDVGVLGVQLEERHLV